jgi:hypothetical protein
MTEQEALKTCSGFININGLIGYFGFRAANLLVSTEKYKFHQVCFWGYVLERRHK